MKNGPILRSDRHGQSTALLSSARLFFSQMEKDQLSSHDAIGNERAYASACICIYACVCAPLTEGLSSSDAKQLSSDEYCSNAIEFPVDAPCANSN